MDSRPPQESELTRRQFLKVVLASGVMAASGLGIMQWQQQPRMKASTFIGQANSYESDLRSILASGFRELGVTPSEIRGKRILLKPNLVETHVESEHINTHPLVVRGAVEAFLGNGSGTGRGRWRRDPGIGGMRYQILEESGLGASAL